jgi:hypothetical protein
MIVAREIGDASVRFKQEAERLIALLRDHNIRSLSSLREALRSSSEFTDQWSGIWREIAQKDGGKLTLSAAGTVVGIVLGGVGIAAMGGAIGLPLAAVLGLGGLVAGSDIDSRRKYFALRIPRALHQRIEVEAKASGIRPADLVLQVLSARFPGGPE